MPRLRLALYIRCRTSLSPLLALQVEKIVNRGNGLIKTGNPAQQIELPVQSIDWQLKTVFRSEGPESTSACEIEAVLLD